jgi:hypothetical protein
MSTHRLHLELSKEVLNVRMLVIEGINCIGAITPTGSGWVCDLPALEMADDNDIDVFAFVEGLPGSKCSMAVVIDAQKAETFSRTFGKKGNTFFNEAVKRKEGA